MTDPTRRLASDLLHIAADHADVWYPAAFALLALVVIGCVWLYVSVVEP